MSKGPEAPVQKAIIDYLQMTDWLIIRINGGKRVDTYPNGKKRFTVFYRWIVRGMTEWLSDGVADVLAFNTINGRFVGMAIEVKAPGKIRNKGYGGSDKQNTFLEEWFKRGGHGLVADDVNDVISYIDEIRREIDTD